MNTSLLVAVSTIFLCGLVLSYLGPSRPAQTLR